MDLGLYTYGAHVEGRHKELKDRLQKNYLYLNLKGLMVLVCRVGEHTNQGRKDNLIKGS